MNKYAVAFNKQVRSYFSIALTRSVADNELISTLKQPIKYAYLYQQSQLEQDLVRGRIPDSITFYAMQGKLYEQYILALQTPLSAIRKSVKIHQKCSAERAARFINNQVI